MKSKNWAKWSKIATERKELTVIHSDFGPTLYLVPLSSKEFYLKPGLEPEGTFSIESEEFIVLFRDEVL